MTDEISSEIKLGLNIILYELFYVDSDFLSNLPPFGQKQHDYYSKFDDDKLNTVGLSLEWAVKHDTYSFNTVYPRHKNISNELIANFLKYTLKGLIDTGLYSAQKEYKFNN